MTALATWDAPVQRPQRSPSLALLPTDGLVPWDDAVELYLKSSGLSDHTQFHVRYSLTSGRVRLFREAFGIASPDDWSPELLERFVVGITRAPENPGGLARESAKTIRKHLVWFGRWLAGQPWGTPALATIPPLPDAGRAHSHQEARAVLLDLVDELPALTKKEARILREAVGCERDHLIVKTLEYTGVRPSEAAGLLVPNVHTGQRDSHITIVGSFWNPQVPKTPAGYRDIPLDIDGNGLPKDYRLYLPKRAQFPTEHPYVFVNGRRKAEAPDNDPPITVNTIKKMLQRLERITKIHCNPYRFRHSFCTWCADAGVPPMQLATWMGHKDTTLIGRYYRRKDNRTAIEAGNRIRF